MKMIAGIDEAGRGPLAGSVVAAAVILPVDHGIVGIRDSKKLSAKKRIELAKAIRQQAIAWGLGSASREEIDALNILNATMLAMRRAIEYLQEPPELILVDGNKVPDTNIPCQAIVRGDSHIEVIAAASILAKVARDEEMLQLHDQYPQYGFDRHKGYPTVAHIDALNKYGACQEHRQSFAPVRRLKP